MENEVKLTELKLDMLPSGNRKLVLENFVLLDDNIDSTEDLELDGIVPTQSFPVSPPPMTITFLSLAEMNVPSCKPLSSSALVVDFRKSTAK